MLKCRTGVLIALLPLILNGANIAACDATQSKKATTSATPLPQSQNNKAASNSDAGTERGVEKAVNKDLKVLAEGGFSRIADTLLIVARDAETYAVLRADAAPNLPELNADFFKSNAIIAAFLGTRRTGGYAVEISRGVNKVVRISAISPEAGGITAQVISSPYRIVAVPLTGTDANLSLDVGDAWKSMMRPYRVTDGDFTMSGGIAGRAEKFRFGGELRAMSFGKLATFAFALKNTDGAKPRLLNGVLTGIVADDGTIKLAGLDAGSFVDNPRRALSITGRFTDKENNLQLMFATLPSNVADGYGGQGTLKAVATAPPLPKRKPALIDEM